MLRILTFVRVLSQRPSASHQQGWTGPPQGEAALEMSLRSLTTCSYVSDATSFAMRHCTIVVTPLPMFPEPDSFRPREIHHRPNASCLGNEKKSPCRWWLIDGCKSLFNVKPSTVPTRLIPELDAHTRTTHPERFLRAEKSRRPNTQHQMGTPSSSTPTYSPRRGAGVF